MLKTLKNLAARIREQVGLTWKAFKAQLAVLLGYKADIGGPVRLGFIVGYYIEDKELSYRFCQALVDTVIQVILDKDPVSDIPGIGKDAEDDYFRFRKHCGHLFTPNEMSKIHSAFQKSQKGFPEHLLMRAAKEIKGNIEKLTDVVQLLRKYRKQYNTKEHQNQPFDDPGNWIMDGLEAQDGADEENEDNPENKLIELGHLKTYYDEVWLRGAAIDVGNVYIVADIEEMYKLAKKWGKQYLIRRLKEKLLRYTGVHSEIVSRLYLVVDSNDKLTQLIVRCPKKMKKKKTEVDPISFATSNKPGSMIIDKEKNKLYAEERYEMNPESDTAKVKRAPGSGTHYAIEMSNRKQYIKTNLVKSSTQAIAIFPLEKYGFERLSEWLVSGDGNGVIIGDTLWKQMQKIGLENAKFNANHLKSKGIGIHQRTLKVKLGDKTIDADILFDLQETRGFDRAMYSPATQMLNAWLKGQNKVEVKTGAEPELIVGEIIDDYGNLMKVLVGLVELQVDASVFRKTKIMNKKLGYPQIATYSPKAYKEMKKLQQKQMKHKKYEIERLFQITNKYEQLLDILHQNIDADNITNRDLNDTFNAIMDDSDPEIPDGLLPAYEIVEKGIRWQDAALTKEQIKKIMSAVDEFVTIRGIDIKPIKYLIKYDGKVMISPELRLLMDAVHRDLDKKGHNYTFYNLQKYFNFVLKHIRSILQPSHNVVAGKHATGGFDYGAILPYKEEYVKLLLKQSTKLSDKAIDDLIDAGIDKVNDVFKSLKFYIHRDPILKEIPEETIQFSDKLKMDVIVVGKKTAKYINGDDDDDNVVVYTLKKTGDNVTVKFIEGLTMHYYGELDKNIIDKDAEIQNFLLNYK